MSKNLHVEETVRLQFEKRHEWIREIRGERLQGIAEGASSAPHLASSSAASFPGRDECSGTHCSLIEEKREDSSCQMVKGMLSPLLFAIAVNVISENARKGLMNEIWYTDDLVLMSKSIENLKKKF